MNQRGFSTAAGCNDMAVFSLDELYILIPQLRTGKFILIKKNGEYLLQENLHEIIV